VIDAGGWVEGYLRAVGLRLWTGGRDSRLRHRTDGSFTPYADCGFRFDPAVPGSVNVLVIFAILTLSFVVPALFRERWTLL
jgi:hypothetical protein